MNQASVHHSFTCWPTSFISQKENYFIYQEMYNLSWNHPT